MPIQTCTSPYRIIQAMPWRTYKSEYSHIYIVGIFKAYDVRGVYPSELSEKDAKRVGMAYGTLINGGTVVVGRDGRASSPSLQEAVIEGLVETGCHVLNIGLVATPVLYYAVKRLRADGGVMVTASHNPPEWNGIKLCDSKANLIGMGFGLERVVEIYTEGSYNTGRGKVEDCSWIQDDYIDRLAREFSLDLRVVVDVGGGSASYVASRVYREAGCMVKLINETVDPYFRCRSPDPDPYDLRVLKLAVKRFKADLGVAYDGDGDRAVFVDDRGQGYLGDIPLAVYSYNILKDVPRGRVLYDVSCSKTVEDTVRMLGGTPVMVRVGHSYMMREMERLKAVLGGEIASHFYFGDRRVYSDATYSTLRMLSIIAAEGSLSEIVGLLPKYYSTPLRSVRVPEDRREKVMINVEKEASKLKGRILRVDGVKILLNHGWILVRPSNTKPEIKYRAEADSPAMLKKLEEAALRLIENAMPT